MKKTVTPFTAQLVTFETSLPFKDVVARLDVELNKPGSLQFLADFRNTTTKEAICTVSIVVVKPFPLRASHDPLPSWILTSSPADLPALADHR